MRYAASIAATFELAFMETNYFAKSRAGTGIRLECNDESKRPKVAQGRIILILSRETSLGYFGRLEFCCLMFLLR